MAGGLTRQGEQRITVRVPKGLLDRLNEHVTPQRRGRFIIEAIEERLAMEEQAAVLEESAGAWRDENHPEMLTADDVDNWLDGLRSSWAVPEDANSV